MRKLCDGRFVEQPGCCDVGVNFFCPAATSKGAGRNAASRGAEDLSDLRVPREPQVLIRAPMGTSSYIFNVQYRETWGEGWD